MIHKLTIKDKEYLLVEVEKDANTFFINSVGCIRYSHDVRNRQSTAIEPMSLGIYATNENCKIINTISNLTEEECKYVIRFGWLGYRDYLSSDEYNTYTYLTAKEAFISLLKAKDIFAKSFVDEPNEKSYRGDHYENYLNDAEKYQNLPDEYLLIEIK